MSNHSANIQDRVTVKIEELRNMRTILLTVSALLMFAAAGE